MKLPGAVLDVIAAVGWALGRVKFAAIVASWRLRKTLRPICWWRGKHNGFYARGRWICRICAKQMIAPPPPGELLTDESSRAVYQTQQDGALRRIDKFRGSKKQRRKHREEVNRLRAMRERLTQGES